MRESRRVRKVIFENSRLIRRTRGMIARSKCSEERRSFFVLLREYVEGRTSAWVARVEADRKERKYYRRVVRLMVRVLNVGFCFSVYVFLVFGCAVLLCFSLFMIVEDEVLF